jgi:hypothetical protein
LNNLDSPKSWQEYRVLMGKAWAKSVMAVLDLARICAEAATKLADEDFTRLVFAVWACKNEHAPANRRRH